MKQFISWAIIKRLTESESILLKRGIEAHFRARLQPYFSVSTYSLYILGILFNKLMAFVMNFEFIYIYHHIYRKWIFLVYSKCWNTIILSYIVLYFIPESVS